MGKSLPTQPDSSSSGAAPVLLTPSGLIPRLSEARKSPPPNRCWLLLLVGLVVVCLSHPQLWSPAEPALWFPPIGIGLVLTAWLGLPVAALVGVCVFLMTVATDWNKVNPLQAGVDGLIIATEIAAGWWWFSSKARGVRRLGDPVSATLFLVIIPGIVVAAAALLQAFLNDWLFEVPFSLESAGQLWLTRALAILIVAPPLLVLATPLLTRLGLAAPESTLQNSWSQRLPVWPLGEAIEIIGLSSGAAVLGLMLAFLHCRPPESTHWQLWSILLLVIVWTSLRQCLPGGTLAASAAALTALGFGWILQGDPGISLVPLQGNLLAQASVALLIGASAGWIRASEARYRQVVGHIPVVLYSARISRRPAEGQRPEVDITLVSPAAKSVLGMDPEQLLGDLPNWLKHIHPQDREVVSGAFGQLWLQPQPVVCEYRLAFKPTSRSFAGGQQARAPQERWVRDTLAPYRDAEGRLEGWEGVVEDITDSRSLAHDLRRTSSMLHALISNLPTGVYFVQGLSGQPVLVNARARQLLGQREDIAAGVLHLASVYRLFKPNGLPYPVEELPVYQALMSGATCMRDDIVVHRADGRKVPLVTWAAPVDLQGRGRPDAAVWVMEDLTALRQVEAAHRESELRLRATIATMAEGLVVQNHTGAIVECNPAAGSILGVADEKLRTWPALGPEEGCLGEDGAPLPRERHPDRLGIASRQPVREVVMGIPIRWLIEHGRDAAAGDSTDGYRWLLINTMPLVAEGGAPTAATALRLVTTFTDITAQRQAMEVLRHSEERYRGLVETLPLLVLQFDKEMRLSYLNPATRRVLGYEAEELTGPGAWKQIVHSDDHLAFENLHARCLAGRAAGGHFHYQARDGSIRHGYTLAQPLLRGEETEGTTFLVVDLTTQRKLEEDLQKAQRLDLVGRLASGFAHDINNLLSCIVSLAELAPTRLEADHPVHDDLKQISEAGMQAGQLTSQLMTFSKQRQVTVQAVPINHVVSRTLDLLRRTLPATIRITSTLCEGEGLALADEAQVQQVLLNLCLNARDAMPEGGLLEIGTHWERLPTTWAAPSAYEPAKTKDSEHDWLRLSVRDTGVGMDDEVKQRVFEPFYTTKEHGTGLGLAVVRQIVDHFGGRISVWSKPGDGTCFDVWLPAAQ